MDDEIRFYLNGKPEIGELPFVDDDEHRRGTLLDDESLRLGDRIERVAPRFVNDQIMLGMLRQKLLELSG